MQAILRAYIYEAIEVEKSELQVVYPTKSIKKAEQFFDKNIVAQIIMAVVIINAWNRIAVSTQLESAQ